MNAFLNLAETQIAAPIKARHRAAEARQAKAPMALTPDEKKQRDQQKLLRQWRSWHHEKEIALLAGPYGKDIAGLREFIKTMTLSSSGALVRLIENATWLRNADHETRYGVLSIVSHGIVRLREQNGLAPFDDSLMGEPLTAFQQIKEMLR